jgi:hypothetical protein
MKVAIVQPNYIPWKGYFDLIHDVDVFVVADDFQYTVRDWRNRNRIKSGRSRSTAVSPGSGATSRPCATATAAALTSWELGRCFKPSSP